MIEEDIKKMAVGQLLKMLEIGFHTGNLFKTGSEDFKKFSFLENEIFNTIKYFSGMPKEEHGVFEADEYIRIAFKYTTGDLSRDEAVDQIFNWKESHK
jgi:hypothetical protein